LAAPERDAPAVVAVLGPTASGKSALGLELARRLDGEILCCDSAQVYRGMDIGTAKPTRAEQAERPHHLLDLVNPGDPFHAAAWAERARAAIAEVRGRGRLPIVVGGTGLYFRALHRGLFEAPPSDPEIRARHQAEAASSGVESLYGRLQGIDPAAAAGILPGDLLRISRALEVYEQTGATITELRRRGAAVPPLRLYTVIFDVPTPALRARISARVQAMMSAGLLDEVRGLREAGFGQTRAMQALGYRQLGAHLDGALSLEAAVADIERTTFAYARRQRTWFRKEVATLRAEGPPDAEGLARAIAGWACDRPPDLAG
jgi:tRNA dimethylallyltransferase